MKFSIWSGITKKLCGIPGSKGCFVMDRDSKFEKVIKEVRTLVECVTIKDRLRAKIITSLMINEFSSGAKIATS
jgi:predicted metal-binding protein